MNNATLFTADRATHAMIVVVALVALIAVCLVGIRVHAKGSEGRASDCIPVHCYRAPAAVLAPAVRLHRLVNTSSDETLKHLCAEINATETQFPRAELRLTYELVSGQSY